ncbi:Uncharacterised protein [Yersinia intermedia]|nr:Uncharacterised protein [Yersinia intermedia]
MRKPDSEYLARIAADDVLYVLTDNRIPVAKLSCKESALVENYRAFTPEHRATLDMACATGGREESL